MPSEKESGIHRQAATFSIRSSIYDACIYLPNNLSYLWRMSGHSAYPR